MKVNRNEYKFICDRVGSFRQELINGKFSAWDEYAEINGSFDYGVAVFEMGYVDIELNICAMCNEDGTGYVNKLDPAYFICVKGFNGDWCDAGYLDDFGYVVNVDWAAEDWREQLKKDMFYNLMRAVKEFDLKIECPNWTEQGHEWDVFDRIHGIKKEG
jgi:hypothetical protein